MNAAALCLWANQQLFANMFTVSVFSRKTTEHVLHKQVPQNYNMHMSKLQSPLAARGLWWGQRRKSVDVSLGRKILEYTGIRPFIYFGCARFCISLFPDGSGEKNMLHLKLICAKLLPCCYIPIMFRLMFLGGMSLHCTTWQFLGDTLTYKLFYLIRHNVRKIKGLKTQGGSCEKYFRDYLRSQLVIYIQYAIWWKATQ